MARVTRPGGRLFIGVPYRWGPFLPFALVPSRHPVSVWMGRLYGCRELRTTCEACGLRVEEVHLYFFGCFAGALLSWPDAGSSAQLGSQANNSSA